MESGPDAGAAVRGKNHLTVVVEQRVADVIDVCIRVDGYNTHTHTHTAFSTSGPLCRKKMNESDWMATTNKQCANYICKSSDWVQDVTSFASWILY